MNVNYTELEEKMATGCYMEVRGPKPDSYEYRQAAQGLNNKRLWYII
jgi:hypothetical protein